MSQDGSRMPPKVTRGGPKVAPRWPLDGPGCPPGWSWKAVAPKMSLSVVLSVTWLCVLREDVACTMYPHGLMSHVS